MTTTLFTDVRVFDGDGLTEPATVLVRDGVIAAVTPGGSPADLPDGAVPEDAEKVAGEGGTLLPGLIDAHLHVNGRKDLDALVQHGVTTGFDMASWPAELTAAMRAEQHTAGMISAGLPFIGPAGPHSHFGMPDGAVVTDPADVPAGVARRVGEGSDWIKVVTEDPGQGGPEPEVVAAVVQAAHAAGRRVVAHASHLGAFTMSLDAGVDVLTHVPTEAAVDADVAARMVEGARIAIPTLSVSKTLTSMRPAPGVSYDNARASVAAMHEAGVPVLAGTDSVDQPGVPFSIPLGSTLHQELVLLVDAGMTPVEALRAATSLPAEHFGLADRGAVREGLRADLLLVGGDPTSDITATQDVRGVWVGGERLR
ncbi:amidohydrolase family protein [Cellulomonas sp. PhB143]|uniref:amidohydrolase family protein n=1 Tax=Cellulomonas sp. PhB143 TaxID=2485186 RepID=UPI000F478D9E|nr:amidohydrolase family protein [Cellulomonas sp. PhB143]ROS75414.1 imidazolonepropionase-like amidohydrolase [Cellulomonas sp. PhB143]